MSQPTLSEYVSALQLLLSDLDSDSRAFVISKAFPNIVIVTKGDSAVTAFHRLSDALFTLNLAASIVDGSSGLGHIAANNAAVHLKNAQTNLKTAMRKLNMRAAYT